MLVYNIHNDIIVHYTFNIVIEFDIQMTSDIKYKASEY